MESLPRSGDACPEVETLDAAEPICSALAEACERLHIYIFM